MIQSLRQSTFFLLFSVLILSPSAAPRILFLGLSGEGAPAIEKSFDRMLRSRINTMPGMSVIGYDESQRHRRSLDLDRSGIISEEQLIALEERLPDSVMVIWAQIKKLAIVPLRRNLIRADIKGTMQTGLTVYNLSRKSFSYSGIVESVASKHKGFILFAPVELETHISAADREELIEKLVADAVAGCADIIESLRRSEQMTPEKVVPLTDTTTNRPPSISDVFAVPSVEAAEISNKTPARKPNSTPTAQSKTTATPPGK